LVRSGDSEESWLNEGLSHLSEDLVAKLVDGGNNSRIAAFLANPELVGLLGSASFNSGKRGAAYPTGWSTGGQSGAATWG